MVKWFNVAWNHGTNRRRYDPNGSLFDWETHKFTFHVDQIIPSVSIILNLNCIFLTIVIIYMYLPWMTIYGIRYTSNRYFCRKSKEYFNLFLSYHFLHKPTITNEASYKGFQKQRLLLYWSRNRWRRHQSWTLVAYKAWVFSYGVFALPDTETDTESDKKWLAWNCVEVFTLHRDKYQHRFPLDLLVLVAVSLSVTVVVNIPLFYWDRIIDDRIQFRTCFVIKV